MLNCSRLGVGFAIANPPGYDPRPEIVAESRKQASHHKCKVVLTHDPEEAVRGADAVYTDVWASMGQEHEAFQRNIHFESFRVDERLMAKAKKNAVFMHCLPAKRGQETPDGVMEARRSIVFDQAEFRLHAQKALLLMLL
jgi:ornithine carbamoyltransferase